MTIVWENVVITLLLLCGVVMAAVIFLNIIRKGRNKK